MEEPQVMSERISRRIAAIAPSATLAVDAQAKALDYVPLPDALVKQIEAYWAQNMAY